MEDLVSGIVTACVWVGTSVNKLVYKEHTNKYNTVGGGLAGGSRKGLLEAGRHTQVES